MIISHASIETNFIIITVTAAQHYKAPLDNRDSANTHNKSRSIPFTSALLVVLSRAAHCRQSRQPSTYSQFTHANDHSSATGGVPALPPCRQRQPHHVDR